MVVLRKHGGDGDGGGDGDDNVDGVQTNWETQFVIVVFARNHCGLRSQLRSSMAVSELLYSEVYIARCTVRWPVRWWSGGYSMRW